jgi:hypothetical protein
LPNRSGDFVKEPGTIEDGNTRECIRKAVQHECTCG